MGNRREVFRLRFAPAKTAGKAEPPRNSAQDDGLSKRQSRKTPAGYRRYRSGGRIGDRREIPRLRVPALRAKEKARDAPLGMTANRKGERGGWWTGSQACAPGTACCAPTKAKARRRERQKRGGAALRRQRQSVRKASRRGCGVSYINQNAPIGEWRFRVGARSTPGQAPALRMVRGTRSGEAI
jgi:hypothetical protein